MNLLSKVLSTMLNACTAVSTAAGRQAARAGERRQQSMIVSALGGREAAGGSECMRPRRAGRLPACLPCSSSSSPHLWG